MPFYDTDLAFVHDSAFGDYARRAGPEIVRLLARSRITRGTIVELGSGSGITAEHLVHHGYRVIGIDASPAMVRLARARIPDATFRVGRIASSTRLPRCAAVIALGEVIGYAVERGHGPAMLVRFFRRVHRALAQKGLLIFDFLESAEGRTFTGRSHAGENWSMTVSATTDRTERWLTRRITVVRHIDGEFRRSQEIHRVRLFDREEVARAMQAGGFTVSFRRSLGRVRLLRGDLVAVARKT